jgi:hypothetical protein
MSAIDRGICFITLVPGAKHSSLVQQKKDLYKTVQACDSWSDFQTSKCQEPIGFLQMGENLM